MSEKMKENKIQELMQDVENYRQAIRDAEDALAAAEQELDEALEEAYDGGPEGFPEESLRESLAG